jgi:exosortase A
MEPRDMALGEIDTMRGANGRALGAWNAQLRGPALVGAVLLFVFLLYASTVRSMMTIWTESSTFTHGFVVVPACAWFVWTCRHELARTRAQPFWPALLVAAGAGFSWMVGDLSASQSITHFALMVLAISSVIALFGLAWARVLAFPLAFLLLAVPFGEDVVPILMDWTADFTVAALKLSGVPVLREGNDFTIPSGRWSVVEACSGARYLLASFVAGTVYAWVMYRSPVRRAAFMLVSLVAPIVANWLRAYFIVMLGHLSDNAIAAGVDHLIYGWLFFGLVIFVVFAVGARWREDGVRAVERAPADTAAAQLSWRHLAPAFAATLAIAVAWPLLSSSLFAAGDKRPVHPVALAPQAGWAAVAAPLLWQPRLEQPRVLVTESFVKNGMRVDFHAGIYRDQRQGSELVNSQNRLSTDRPSAWRQVSRGSASVAIGDRNVIVRSALVRNSSGELLRVWHCYWLGSRWTASDVRAKIDLALDRLLLRSDTSAWIAVSTAQDPDSPQRAQATLRAFLAEMSPSIEAALTATAGQ